MRVRKLARPIANVKANATAQDNQARSNPQTPHRRARACMRYAPVRIPLGRFPAFHPVSSLPSSFYPFPWHVFFMYGKKRGGIMKTNELLKKIAKLESLCDQLQSEMNYVDELLKEVGFEEGMKTLKEAAIELLEKKKDFPNMDYFD